MTIRIDADWMFPYEECDRVAIYLTQLPYRFWMEDRKKVAVELVPGLTDSEWKRIQEYMTRHAIAGTTYFGKRVRTDWIRALDTLREFER
jgi:hypothetical protein